MGWSNPQLATSQIIASCIHPHRYLVVKPFKTQDDPGDHLILGLADWATEISPGLPWMVAKSCTTKRTVEKCWKTINNILINSK